MTSAVDLITLALKDVGALGIGQSISPEDTADALATLNMMLGQWESERLMVYHLVDASKQSTGAQAYTVGTGGDWNINRPVAIASAFARLNLIDFPITILKSREDYNRIAFKSLMTMPSYLFYDAAFPLGNLYFWPVPNSSYELHITAMDVLPQFTVPGATVNLPPAYFAAIRYNLAVWLAPSYQIEPTNTLSKLAAKTLRTIRNMNTAIPGMKMPSGLASRSRYNVFTGLNY